MTALEQLLDQMRIEGLDTVADALEIVVEAECIKARKEVLTALPNFKDLPERTTFEFTYHDMMLVETGYRLARKRLLAELDTPKGGEK